LTGDQGWYLPVALVPDRPESKHPVMHLRGVDRSGRQFIVETQMPRNSRDTVRRVTSRLPVEQVRAL
jgi:hypothetical protein